MFLYGLPRGRDDITVFHVILVDTFSLFAVYHGREVITVYILLMADMLLLIVRSLWLRNYHLLVIEVVMVEKLSLFVTWQE